VTTELPLSRVYLMRVGCLVIRLGLAVVTWPCSRTPAPCRYSRAWFTCLFTGLSLLACLGLALRRPADSRPAVRGRLELIWLSVVALPGVLAGEVDDATGEVVFNCSLVVVILAVIPWRYVAALRWRSVALSAGTSRRRGCGDVR